MWSTWTQFLSQFSSHRHREDDGSFPAYERSTNSRKKAHVWLRIDDLAIMMRANHPTYVMEQLGIDESSVISLQVVDTDGNLVADCADFQWTSSDDGVLAASRDGASLVIEPAADTVGKATTLHLHAQIGGIDFNALLTESVVEAAGSEPLDADRLRKRRRRHHRRRNRQRANDATSGL